MIFGDLTPSQKKQLKELYTTKKFIFESLAVSGTDFEKKVAGIVLHAGTAGDETQ